MATMATERAIDRVTIIAGITGFTIPAPPSLPPVAIPRGARCSLSTDGTNVCYVQDGTRRGDYIAVRDIYAGLIGGAVRLNTGAEVVALAAVAFAVNDPVYSAANGQVTNVATGAVYMGRAREAAAAGTLFGILLETVA